jgi:hypothetical protein
MTRLEREALERLLAIAHRDTGQSRRVADFLLAWHNAEENGGWDPAEMWAVDQNIAHDMITVLRSIRDNPGVYPPDCGFQATIERVWKLWRGAPTDKL